MKIKLTFPLIQPAVFWLLLSTFNLPPSTAHASVTNVVWYRLGENDPGAANGAAVAGA